MPKITTTTTTTKKLATLWNVSRPITTRISFYESIDQWWGFKKGIFSSSSSPPFPNVSHRNRPWIITFSLHSENAILKALALFLSVCLALSVRPIIYACPILSVSLYLCFCISHFVCLSVSLCLSGSVCICLYLSLFICFYLYSSPFFVCLSLSLSLCLILSKRLLWLIWPRASQYI